MQSKDEQFAKQKDKKIKDVFLHELALLLLAETPIKSAVRNRTIALRGEILYSLKNDQREVYTNSRNVILEFARLMANAENLDQIAHVLGFIQDLNQGEVHITDNELITTDEQ